MVSGCEEDLRLWETADMAGRLQITTPGGRKIVDASRHCNLKDYFVVKNISEVLE